MIPAYLRFLAYIVIGALGGLVLGLLLELIGAPQGWALVLLFAGMIVAAVLSVVQPRRLPSK
ncbi:MAG: hypothetical protein HYY04_00955 [Chloroflexi bacterium]|nr:hypothetical protein [Chloroflexota bacterium]